MGSSTAFSFEARHAPAAPIEESICACHLVAVDRPKYQLRFHHLYIGHVRVTTVDFAHGKQTDDSSVIVSINGIEHFAVVQEIFSVDEQHSFLQVRCLSNSRPFIWSTKQSRFALQSIQQGSMDNQCLVPSSNFVEKCVRIDY